MASDRAEPGDDFRPAAEVLGQPGADLFDWFVTALIERAGVDPKYRVDIARSARLEVTFEPDPAMIVAFEGVRYEPPWDGTIANAKEIVADLLPDLAGQVKADRGRLGGVHPWDQ